MLKSVTTLLSAVLLAGTFVAPAMSAPAKHKPAPAHKMAAKPVKPKPNMKAMASQAHMASLAAGTKVFMNLSGSVKSYTRNHGTRAAAAATMYTNRDGALTGLTIQSWGLPDPERMDARSSRYVVWLVDDQGQRVRKLGQLESRNGAHTVFGFTPERPISGFGRLMITAEAMDGVSHPSGMMHMSAELPAAHKLTASR